MLISLIIPVYNGAQFIHTCYDSLIKQTDKEWEAIFINDGSTDQSLELLDALARQDSRVKVESQQNMGVVYARDKGVKMATGDWIFFLDVDDTLPPSYLSSMRSGIQSGVDIVYSGCNLVSEGKIIKSRVFEDKILSSIDFMKLTMRGFYSWELWGKLYNSELFRSEISLPEDIHIGEDAAINMQLIIRSRNVHVINSTAYNYVQFSSSASHVVSLKKAEENIQAAFFITSYLHKLEIYKQISDECKAMCLLFFTNSTRRGYLGNDHPLVKRIFKECMTIKALHLMPFAKSVYVLFCRVFGKFGNKMIMKYL